MQSEIPGQSRPVSVPDDGNPFDDALAHENSSYAAFRDGKLVHPLDPGAPVRPLEEFVHDGLRALVLNPRFACVAARGAFHRGDYRLGVYGDMAAAPTTMGLARDLYAFTREQARMDAEGGGFSTFLATFTGPCAPDEAAFERLLWAQLQALHDQDCVRHGWDAQVSADPADGAFSFSFAGRAFFVLGLHPAASRWTRRFAWPTLVFNAHAQFEQLRQDGRYAPLQNAIRARDTLLQGGINPMLQNFGEASEARQYAGRSVGEDWRCPFHALTEGIGE